MGNETIPSIWKSELRVILQSDNRYSWGSIKAGHRTGLPNGRSLSNLVLKRHAWFMVDH